MISLQDKVAIVTGGSRGIGAATAELLARAGAHVVVTYRSRKKEADLFIQEMKRWRLACEAVKVDVTNEQRVSQFVGDVEKRHGGIDILVNSAGIWVPAPIGATSTKRWRETIEVNLVGTFNFCNAVVPFMKLRGGKIVNIASTAGQRGEAGYSHYAASKGGVIAFTKSIAAELAPYGINVNCVAPGWVTTDMVAGALKRQAARREIIKSIPRGRIAKPEEIAGPVLFLCSELAIHMVGAIVSVNGGSVMA
ncbi:MAG: SDR family oxidoreductase [Ignavibacteria bacterium]|nr:SDR family oxidoreductase [Ignavibacteria bacterium]